MFDWTQLIVQTGAVGLLGYVLWLVFSRQGRQTDAANERNTKEHNAIVDALKGVRRGQEYSSALLIQMYASIHGENKDAGQTQALVERAKAVTKANGIGI